jgi:hypothetical protein
LRALWSGWRAVQVVRFPEQGLGVEGKGGLGWRLEGGDEGDRVRNVEAGLCN